MIRSALSRFSSSAMTPNGQTLVKPSPVQGCGLCGRSPRQPLSPITSTRRGVATDTDGQLQLPATRRARPPLRPSDRASRRPARPGNARRADAGAASCPARRRRRAAAPDTPSPARRRRAPSPRAGRRRPRPTGRRRRPRTARVPPSPSREGEKEQGATHDGLRADPDDRSKKPRVAGLVASPALVGAPGLEPGTR